MTFIPHRLEMLTFTIMLFNVTLSTTTSIPSNQIKMYVGSFAEQWTSLYNVGSPIVWLQHTKLYSLWMARLTHLPGLTGLRGQRGSGGSTPPFWKQWDMRGGHYTTSYQFNKWPTQLTHLTSSWNCASTSGLMSCVPPPISFANKI